MEEKQRKENVNPEHCGKLSPDTTIMRKKRQWQLLDEDEEMEASVVHHKKLKERNEDFIKDIFEVGVANLK